MFVQLIIAFIFIAVCCTIFWKKKEHFWFIPQGISICDNVSGLSRHQCKRCTNAGYCKLPSGETKCVSGDWRGPYNGEQCVGYEYGNLANLSLVDAPEPMWVDMNKHWNWTAHLGEPQETPVSTVDGQVFFRHGMPPLGHHKKI